MVERERDDSGRPRNLRPRDALGRPQPLGTEGVPRIPDDLVLSAAETLGQAQRLLDRGLAFNAHEVFEAAWKNGPADERALWQGLAQLAVGITHVQRGNVTGACAVLRRAANRLGEVDRCPLHRVDVAALTAYIRGLVDDLTAGTDVTPGGLRPTLTAP